MNPTKNVSSRPFAFAAGRRSKTGDLTDDTLHTALVELLEAALDEPAALNMTFNELMDWCADTQAARYAFHLLARRTAAEFLAIGGEGNGERYQFSLLTLDIRTMGLTWGEEDHLWLAIDAAQAAIYCNDLLDVDHSARTLFDKSKKKSVRTIYSLARHAAAFE